MATLSGEYRGERSSVASWAPRFTEPGGEVGKAMAEPQTIKSEFDGEVTSGRGWAPKALSSGTRDAIVRVLRPKQPFVATTLSADPMADSAIAWLAPTDPELGGLRDDLYLDLYDGLRDDLRDGLSHEVRQGLRADLRADLGADLAVLRTDLYAEVDELRDDVFAAPETEAELRIGWAVRARRAAFVTASVLSLVLFAAIALLWQRADTVQSARRPTTPRVVAPLNLNDVTAHVDRLEQQLAGLLAASSSPAAPADVLAQIEALRSDLVGVRGCLRAFRRAIDDGVSTSKAIQYC